MTMDQEPDAVEAAIAELRAGGIPEDRIEHYADWIRRWADVGEPGNQWQTTHLCAAARGYARLDARRRGEQQGYML